MRTEHSMFNGPLSPSLCIGLQMMTGFSSGPEYHPEDISSLLYGEPKQGAVEGLTSKSTVRMRADRGVQSATQRQSKDCGQGELLPPCRL